MRNRMHAFGSEPQANIPRSKFSMPCNVKFTGNAGKLIPFYVAEVLPGDTFNVSTSLVCRLQTLLHPIFDNIYLDTYYFFVPNRLVWDHWKNFMGESDKAWVPSTTYSVPVITINYYPSSYTDYNDFLSCFKDSVVDYMGVGLSPNNNLWSVMDVNALPIRAYNKIYDDWFRDENLEDPVNLYTGDISISLGTLKTDWNNPLKGGACYDACKLHDYFTSALPQAQRGNAVTLNANIDSLFPVKTGATPHTSILEDGSFAGMRYYTTGEQSSYGISYDSGTSAYTRAGVSSTSAYAPNNLYAEMIGDMNLGITINDLRMAFQVQKFMEREARGGSRYIEIIKSMFGVTSPDARMQRSEYLGGHRVPINIHQVINMAESASADLGNTAAMSVTSDVHNDFIHSFTEHGFVIGICTVRYKHSYPQGLDKMWLRRNKFDYYWPVFANIGEQPIYNDELYPTYSKDVFGYQEAWADYRYKPNRVMGEMRPGVPNTLASWHLADYYTSQPTLSSTWIKEDLSMIDRAIAVQSSVADQFLFDVMINNEATRPMPLYSIPGLVDHF